MSDYKNTLNLPKTDFPMKANLAQQEPVILKKWAALNLYQTLRKHGQDHPKFILHDGPPYANAHIHMGTAVNKILKDIIVKSKTMSGFDAPYVPGWDCHGLPIELNVEKKVGKPGQKISAAEFRKACRAYATSQIDIQREEFKRLGIVGDWDHPYLTMNFTYEANVVRSLAKIIENGHVQKGAKPVHWCLDCSSALSEAEVEYKDKLSSAIDVRFRVIDKKEFLARFNELPNNNNYNYNNVISIPIWTTTPWTLPANQAVALNPDHTYVIVDCNGKEFLLIAESLVTQVMQRIGILNYQILSCIQGKQLEHIQLQHPFYEHRVPVVLGEHVTFDAGTGAVHTAPAHGIDDYSIGQHYQLPLENPVGDDGCFTARTALLAGLHVTKVEEQIMHELKSHENLLHLEKITHSYPHCWRHKTPLIFRATPQWFIALDKNHLREKALAAIQQVAWSPEWGQKRIASMISHRPDWCISRQRTWGVPIAIFLHKETGEMHPDSIHLMETVAKKIEQSGVDIWFDLDPKELLGADAAHYKKCHDILDVWFDSGVSHACVLQQHTGLHFPADLYLEGSDQHRGWFNSSLLTSVAIHDQAPYKTVSTHGYVIDIEGRKMSKSLGNVISPETITQSLGADVLRLWVSAIDYSNDIFVSDEILTRTSETYRRLRNTARFLLANLAGFDPEKDLVPSDKMLALDQWAVDKARLMQTEIIAAFNTYQFHLIYQKIHQFCSIDLGSFYLDIIKDRQYTTKTNSLARRSTQTALFHIIEALTRWLAPILSFTAEEIWMHIPGKRNESVFLNTWYTALPALEKNAVMNQLYWEKIRLIRDAVNKELENQRNTGQLGSPLEGAVYLYCTPELKTQLEKLENELRFVLITSRVEIHLENSRGSDAVTTDIPGLWLKVEKLNFAKCERCWHRCEEIGENPAHITLCARCIENIDGTGEVRKYA